MKDEWDEIQQFKRKRKELEQLTNKNPKYTTDRTKDRIIELIQILKDNKIQTLTKKEQS